MEKHESKWLIRMISYRIMMGYGDDEINDDLRGEFYVETGRKISRNAMRLMIQRTRGLMNGISCS